MGLFRDQNAARRPLADVIVWQVPLHVRAGTSPLPAPLVGAYVQVFCRGENATTAAWAAIQAVEAMGFTVPDSPSSVNQLRAADYEHLVSANWPELRARMPTQDEFYKSLAEHRAIMGPFAGYKTPTA